MYILIIQVYVNRRLKNFSPWNFFSRMFLKAQNIVTDKWQQKGSAFQWDLFLNKLDWQSVSWTDINPFITKSIRDCLSWQEPLSFTLFDVSLLTLFFVDNNTETINLMREKRLPLSKYLVCYLTSRSTQEEKKLTRRALWGDALHFVSLLFIPHLLSWTVWMIMTASPFDSLSRKLMAPKTKAPLDC